MNPSTFILSFIMATAISVVAIDVSAQERTDCWNVGKELRCRSQEPPRPLIGPDGNPQSPGYRLPKETRCWRVGDRVECRTN